MQLAIYYKNVFFKIIKYKVHIKIIRLKASIIIEKIAVDKINIIYQHAIIAAIYHFHA